MNFARRQAAARRLATFFLGPRLPAARAEPESLDPLATVAALYGNRAYAADAFAAPAGGVVARREPLGNYLAVTSHASASMLRRVARGEPADGAGRLPARGLGEAFHAFLLEPRRFEREYFRPRAVSATGVEALEDRVWLSEREHAALEGMRASVLAFRGLPLARWLDEGTRELSLYWTDPLGGRWKARPDCFTAEVILEVKTTADVRPAAFARTRARFGYDLQAAHYLDAVTRLVGGAPRFV
ncbi:MAG: PD-(D/E)XK nuclease-like domain-containing protein, partial [Burkholderiales bacterium]|nr:PD-(D/E)XK nuclease-like domain-containing protein [Burkholderiales bacterium]